MRLGKKKAVQLGLPLLLIGTLAAQLATARGTPYQQAPTRSPGGSGDGQAETDWDVDGVLYCAPGVGIHGHAGFIGIGDTAPTKSGALTNYLAGKSAVHIPVVASDFSQHSAGDAGGVLWVSRDRQVLTIMEQDAKGEWYVAARSACTDVFEK